MKKKKIAMTNAITIIETKKINGNTNFLSIIMYYIVCRGRRMGEPERGLASGGNLNLNHYLEI